MITGNLARSTETDRPIWELPEEASVATLGNPQWRTVKTSGSPPQRQVTSERDLAPWVQPVTDRLAKLSALPYNWDSYGARAVSSEAIGNMILVLPFIMRPNTPTPTIVPTSRGYLQAEWHINGVDLEIQVKSSTLILVSFEDRRTGQEWEREVNYDFSELSTAIQRLTDIQLG